MLALLEESVILTMLKGNHMAIMVPAGWFLVCTVFYHLSQCGISVFVFLNYLKICLYIIWKIQKALKYY